MNNFNILCIIPARSGSKSLVDKNIKNFKGKPLLAWSILQAQSSSYIKNMRIIVSTDSDKYAKIAKDFGAEVPFLRPSSISDDNSTDFEFIKHAVDWLKKNENYESDIILHLRPTQPCRKIDDIDKCLNIFINNYNNYDSLRTVIELDKSPFKAYEIDKKNNNLKPLFKEINNIKEPYNQCRQILPKTYLHNGYIDILKTNIINKGTISGDNIYPYIMSKKDKIDIDDENDWNKAIQH
jgi:CMP-N-acetylneuraminic acid synthetase